MNIIQELQEWFQKQCNGKWEHEAGIEITTCDNPGWWIIIALKETNLENKPFEPIIKNVPQDAIDLSLGFITIEEWDERIRRSIKEETLSESEYPEDWLICYIKDKKFNGVGDASKLEQILKIFLDWAKS